jgi:tetratricopeptide (TPR) repeat protein
VPWLILVVAVLAVLGALSMWGPGRGGPVPSDPQVGAASSADTESVIDDLSELGDLFAKVMENNRDAQTVIDRIDGLIVQNQDLPEAHTLRGQMLIYAGRAPEALTAFQASLELQPRQADIHRMAGGLAMKLGQYDDARHHYEQARSIEPGNGEHAVYLANLQVKLNEDDQATETLLAALRRNSELHGAYALLSDIYAKKNKLNLALGQIQRAIETAPNDTTTRLIYVLKRAALQRRDNQPAESLATLNALPQDIRLQPKVLQDTATSWAMLGKPLMAAELYERVLAVDPSSDLAAAAAAHWQIKAGNVDAARQHVQTLRRINPRYTTLPELERKLREHDQSAVE